MLTKDREYLILITIKQKNKSHSGDLNLCKKLTLINKHHVKMNKKVSS
jgi:hypothetical protein